ncbi:related to salicylate hydroxylase [Phialocephala subalpina]|uniref:Related to salicylate hydroxylase n=1 Tax=Phialocephala subalpina TaxID=576137 RepID=A0A1L7XRD9_9HELO|nr:related to salicylate hydroxylase [Phialocephala subalpina]
MARDLKVLIIGGGIGGLSAAIAIRFAGHSVTILEAEEEITEVGAGLQFSANATRILIKWGVDKLIVKDVHHLETNGAPFWDIHRHDLIKALHSMALELGAEVRVQSRVSDLDFGTGSVVLQNGEVLQGDLVIGADGLNSTCRKKLIPDDEEPEFTGDMAFRVLLNLEDLPPNDPDFLEITTRPQCTYWLGPSHHAIVYILRGGTQINLVAVVPDDLPRGVVRAPCDTGGVLKLFEGFDPLLLEIISQVPQTFKWKLRIRPELKKWSHDSGKFTLLGDAAHPTLPYLSQGAGITLEDAAVLGQLLTEPIPLAKVLAKYESIRRPRTTSVVKASSQQQYWYNLPDRPEQRERDRIMSAEIPQEEDPFLWKDPVFAPWLFGYDAHEEARKVVGKYPL